MPRNFLRRIEVIFPIEDGNLRERLLTEIFATILEDNQKARFLQPDGTYRRPALKRDTPRRRSQADFISLAALDVQAITASARKLPAKHPRMKLASKPQRAAR